MAPFPLPPSAGKLPIVRPALRFLSQGYLHRVPTSSFQYSLPSQRRSFLFHGTQSIRNISHHRRETQPSTPTNAATARDSSSPRQSAPAASLRQRITAIIDQLGAPLDRLGATRTVKIVVIACLSIFGTLETIFYMKAAIRWFSASEGEAEK